MSNINDGDNINENSDRSGGQQNTSHYVLRYHWSMAKLKADEDGVPPPSLRSYARLTAADPNHPAHHAALAWMSAKGMKMDPRV